MLKKLLIATILCIAPFSYLSVNGMEKNYDKLDVSCSTSNNPKDELNNQNSITQNSIVPKTSIEEIQNNMITKLKSIKNYIEELEKIPSVDILKQNYHDYFDYVCYIGQYRSMLWNIITTTKQYLKTYENYENIYTGFIEIYTLAEDLLARARALHNQE